MRARRRTPGAPPPAPETMHDVALRMLARRALSRAEVEERLGLRGFPDAAVRAELARLGRAGLVDDGALAFAVCREQLRAGRGRRAVAAALKRRRVEKDAAAAALADLTEGDEEAAALAAAAARATARHRFWQRLPEERRKVIRYLLARGFGLDAVRRTLEEKRREERNGEQTDDAGDPPGLP